MLMLTFQHINLPSLQYFILTALLLGAVEYFLVIELPDHGMYEMSDILEIGIIGLYILIEAIDD